MRAIYKYSLPRVTGEFTLELPRVWEEVAIQIQHSEVVLWAYVDTETEREVQRFWMYGTGHEIKDWASLQHIGTVQDGPFVWHYFHVFEREED